MTISFRPMRAEDALRIQRQPSQRIQLGEERGEISLEEAQDLAECGEAWTAWRGETPIALFGLRETFPPVQGVAWAILSQGLGADHLAITRRAARMVRESALVRIEAIVPLDSPAEAKWAELCGLKPGYVLEKFGAASEPHLLLERIR